MKENPDTKVHWPVIDIEAIDAQDHSRSAALQIADCGVSAIAAAIEPDQFGNVEKTYLHELKSNIYSRKGKYLSYGLKTLPALESLKLSKSQQNAFEDFK